METPIRLHHSLFWYLFLIPTLTIAIPVDTITPTQPLTENQTLVSAGELFELGFFRPDNSGKLYVGIWYNRIAVKTIVWVANRDKPVRNTSGILEIGEDGNIQLVDTTGNPMWSSSNQSTARNTVAQLLDSGNFVLRQENDENPENYLWQSFDYPTDTLLPGMKLGWDAKTGRNRYVSSWKSSTDPSEGDYSFKLDINGSSPEAYLRNRDKIIHRSGAWNGVRFSGAPGIGTEEFITSSFVMTKQEIYYTFEIQNKTLYSRLLVNHTGYLERSTWIEANRIWNVFWFGPRDQCDIYKECGTFGICDTNDSPVCECLVGFKPRNQQAWDLRDGSDGCFRYHETVCETDGFLTLEYMKLPETKTAFVDAAMSLDQCKEMCFRDCSCTAYTNSNISGGGSGCIIWTAELLDMRRFSAGSGQPLYVRVAASDADENGDVARTGDGSGKTKKIILACGITFGIIGLFLFGLFQLKRRKSRRVNRRTTEFRGERGGDHLMNAIATSNKRELSGETIITTDEFELPVFDLSTIVIATDNFANANKLGQGGFGSVYKGILVGGEEIAVKRLSKNSGQGVEEFKNELKLIARLQHRNLVRLLGCCVDNEEKMLVYEYMENKSLDSILFNKQKSSLLDWKTRFNIICGIARGLLYLHQDSRFRIIHRDLKASNILLDKEMNPKISDFGMARIFGGDETEANNTIRVVGTYGYMSPEYAMDGLFSVKSDVFSFGVLVLEIVTGKHNRGFYKQNNEENLLGLAWRLWRERRGLELRDSTMTTSETYSEWDDDQVMRSIQVGLLCVQEKAEDRPNMATVVFMLSSEGALLPQPKQPGFCLGNNAAITNSSSSHHNHQTLSLNQLTVTALHGR